MPPHLISGDKKVASVNETVIDTGYLYEELKEIVSLGDFISYDMPFRKLKGEDVASPALDDRCGMAAIVYALDLLKKEKLDTKVTVMFSRQEELGEIGASTGCFEINPDIALEVDVSFAVTNDDNPLECGKFEEGAMIGYSPSLSREISDKLKETAEKKNWQDRLHAVIDELNKEDNRRLILNAFYSVNPIQLDRFMQNYFRPAVEEILTEYIQDVDISEENREFMIRMYDLFWVDLVMRWIQSGMEISEMTGDIEKIMYVMTGSSQYIAQSLKAFENKDRKTLRPAGEKH